TARRGLRPRQESLRGAGDLPRRTGPARHRIHPHRLFHPGGRPGGMAAAQAAPPRLERTKRRQAESRSPDDRRRADAEAPLAAMLSVDTNILFHAFNEDSPSHAAAYAWITSIQRDEDVAVSEFILAELYGLLRNPAVLEHPLSGEEAVEVVQTYRSHPRWRLIGFPAESRPMHDGLWKC